MGVFWSFYRIGHVVLKKSFYFEWKNADILRKVKRNAHCLENNRCHDLDLFSKHLALSSPTLSLVDALKQHKVYAFHHCYYSYQTESGLDWFYNPLTQLRANPIEAWHKQRDFGAVGDIKLVWEPSRFFFVWGLIHAYQMDGSDRHAILFRDLVLDWIEKNPFPQGPHYMCGQEITFRLIQWVNGLSVFGFVFSEFEKQTVYNSMYVQWLRIEANIGYARHCVKNNHAVSEAVGLYLGSLVFPDVPEAQIWAKKGLAILKEALDYQVYEDGSYIQHSFTYHRLVMDVLSYFIIFCSASGVDIPDFVRVSHKKMALFLWSMVQKNGDVPNFGTNDGAMFFAFPEISYRNFLPSINLAFYLNDGHCVTPDDFLIRFFKLGTPSLYHVAKKTVFEQGGYYILKNDRVFILVRCHTFRHRPSQCDNFHLDIWLDGENLFSDSGSYSYNAKDTYLKTLKSCVAHNTVSVNGHDDMRMVLNFGWSNWSKAECRACESLNFVGEHYGYWTDYGVVIQRSVELRDREIVIHDRFLNIPTKPVTLYQYWQSKSLHSDTVSVVSSAETQSVEPGFQSLFYSEKHPSFRRIFSTSCSTEIITTIQIL